MKLLSVLGLACGIVLASCQKPSERLNAPPQGCTDNPSAMQKPYAAMVDNAALADMSVADIHFAGPTARLSGTGEYRMKQLADICRQYGGEVRYDANTQDETLIQARLDSIEAYLAAAGCDMDKCAVRAGLPASADMPVRQAVLAQQVGLDGSGAAGGGAGSKSAGMANGGADR